MRRRADAAVGSLAAPLVALFALGGCAELDAADTLTEPDFEYFVEHVQPVLSSRCANPSCHGDSTRPLEVFAVHAHRLNPADVFVDAPLTEEELQMNYLRACGFLAIDGPASDSMIMLKPLAQEAGGGRHFGGAQFMDADAAGYRALETWIDGRF